MIRKTITLVWLISLMSLTFACSQMESKDSNIEQINEFMIPSEYSHAKEMLDSLSNQGIRIQDIKGSNLSALFGKKSMTH